MENTKSQVDSRSNVHHVVEGVFQDIFRDKTLTIHNETNAESIEGWDSLTHITLIVTIEKKFGVKFKLAEVQELRNVGDILSLVNSKLEK